MAKRPPSKPRQSRTPAPVSDQQQAVLAEQDRVRSWMGKIRASNKAYEEWEKDFTVKRGEDYYKSRQWYGLAEDEAQKRYVINLIMAAVETQKPSLLFDQPEVRIEPRPSREDQLAETILQAEAKLCQEAVQTFIDDPDVQFLLETGLAVHEAHFRFGIVEVGYSADYIDNPHAGKPVLPEKDADVAQGKTPAEVEDDEAGGDAEDDDATEPKQPARVPQPGTERIYLKRVPSKNFRVSISDRNDLAANEWVGYYEWLYVSDLKQNPKYANTEELKPTGSIDKKYADSATSGPDAASSNGMVKVWKIWDLRAKKKLMLADGHKLFLLDGEPFKFLPFADLKFLELPDQYYPMPLVFNWLGPQDEVNEDREVRRTHRRRFNRRYTYQKGSIDSGELQKLESGGDGVYAEANKPNPIQAVEDAPLDPASAQTAGLAENDFAMVSGVSGEQRQVATADTATQASIMDSRARLRESKARITVRNWLGKVARLMLLAMREDMQLPFLVKGQLDPQLATPEEQAKTALLWKAITSKDLGDIDMDVSVTLESLSPIVQESARLAWNQVLALFSNPAILVLLTQSETLLRKTLALYSVTSEHEIQEIAKVAGAMLQQMQQMAAAGGAPGGVSLPNQGAAAVAAGVRPAGGGPAVGMVQ